MALQEPPLPPRPPGAPPVPLRKASLPDGVFDEEPSLEKHDADALRTVLHALYDDDELEDFFDEHCATFEDYAGHSTEHKLEWTQLHNEYVILMEERIEAAVGRSSLQSSARLFELLRRVAGSDKRASAFISQVCVDGHLATPRQKHGQKAPRLRESEVSTRSWSRAACVVERAPSSPSSVAPDRRTQLLSMGDFHHFCDLMADRQREALALERFEAKALGLQLEMTRLDSQLGMD